MPKTAPRPGSVWDTNTAPNQDLTYRHIEASYTALTPQVARQVIATYTAPGDTVCDPNPGPGLVLAEAIRAGRHAVGLHTPPRRNAVLEASLESARRVGPVGSATLLDGADDPRATDLPGAIDLVLTGLPHTPTSDPSQDLVELYEDLNAVADWVWPGGHLVVTCPPWQRHGHLLDLPGMIHDAANTIGLIPADHCIALTTPLRGKRGRPRVVSRSGQKPGGTAKADPSTTLSAYLDVLVFQLPEHSSESVDRLARHLPSEEDAR